MSRTSPLAGRAVSLGLLCLAAVLALAAAGCSKNPAKYSDPTASITTTQTPTSLIDVATLKQWIDEGKLNNNEPTTRDRIVIVEVTTAAAYAAGHIPGSVLLNSSTEAGAARLEAVASLTSEPPTGPMMDAMLQRWGVDKNTTIVLTTSRGGGGTNAPRAYFTLRYWGFPRERVKLLQGADSLWVAGGNALSTTATIVRPSAMSVRDNYTGSTANLGMRTAIGDMISTVDGINAGTVDTSATGVVILDERGGSTPSWIANAKIDDYNQYLVSGFATAMKPVDQVTARFATFGVTASKRMTYVYCASGHRASVAFFLLDGVLHWPVTLYDGSSGQWLAYVTANNVNSAWRIDSNSPGTTKPRTSGTITAGTLVLDPTANTIYTSITDPRANQIFVEDKAYFTTGQVVGSGGGTGGGGNGTGSGC